MSNRPSGLLLRSVLLLRLGLLLRWATSYAQEHKHAVSALQERGRREIACPGR